MTHDSYFMILVEVFMNYMLAENTYFTNLVEWTNRMQDYGLKTYKQIPCRNAALVLVITLSL